MHRSLAGGSQYALFNWVYALRFDSFFPLQVLLRVLFCLWGVSPRRPFPWGFTSRTHLCLRFKLKRRQRSRRPPRSHLCPLSLPSLSQMLRLISALLGIRVPFGSTLPKSSIRLKVTSWNRILRMRPMTRPFPLKPKHARLHFHSHLLVLPLQRRRLISENTSKRRRMCILTVCPLISQKISCSRLQVALVRFVVCGHSPGTSRIVKVDMGSFCTSFFVPSLLSFG
jgi:hypothetical protein